MSTPEPLDEYPATGQAETRGGDQFADITVEPALSPDEIMAAARAHDAQCDCDDGAPE